MGDAVVHPATSDEDDGSWRDRSREALLVALANEDPEIAGHAALALGRAGDERDRAAVLAVVADPNRPALAREAASLAIGLFGRDDAAGRKALEQLAADADAPLSLRVSATFGLGLRGDASALSFLLQTTARRKGDWQVPSAGTTSLGFGKDQVARTELETVLARKTRGSEVLEHCRAYAAHGLARLGDREALPALRKAARKGEDDARRAALLAIGALADAQDDATAEALARAVHREKDWMSRGVAALSLGRSGSARAKPALLHLYRRGSLRERPFAALGLGLLARETKDTSVLDPLVKDLGKRASHDEHGAIVIALGLGHDRRGDARMRELATTSRDERLRAHAALALGMVGDGDEGRALLRRILSDTDSRAMQREAATALGLLGDTRAVDKLMQLCRHCTCPDLEGSAQLALGRIGGARGTGALVEVLGDEKRSEHVRAMAAAGLGIALERDADRELADLAEDLNWLLTTDVVRDLIELL